MNGYSTMREVMIVAQSNGPADFQVRFREGNQAEWRWSRTFAADAACNFTSHILIDSLLPGKVFRYEVFMNGEKLDIPWNLEFVTQELWQYRKDPPAFKMALGSCFFVNETEFDRPGNPYGGDYQIMASILDKSPDLMVWLGDNVYLREADFDSRFGIFHRYTHTRSLKELQPLLGSVHHYAIWDDHDYGPNDSDRGFPMKETTRDAFNCFWGNPGSGVSGEGVGSAFRWADVDVFLLDDRWFRAPDERKTGDRTMIGEMQFQWLIDNLRSSQAPFKLVCVGSQVLNTTKKYETWENLYPEERGRLLETIRKENIKGVVFLTGDRHHSELSMWQEKEGPVVYDLTVSPLTSGAHDAENETNTLRVSGTHYGKRNFAILEFSGPRTKREMRIALYDVDGKEVWARAIQAP